MAQELLFMGCLETQFVARSGMEDAIASGILRGRPFGGISITWSSDLNHLITPLTNYKHKRVVAVELQTKDAKFLFVSAYLPFYNSSKREECLLEAVDAIAMTETIIDDHPLHRVVIGGDLNSEMKGVSPFDALWKDVMTKHDLMICDNLVMGTLSYTYHHESLNQKKWNDHFLVSKGIHSSSILKKHRILDEGENVSDHLPLVMELSLSLTKNEKRGFCPKIPNAQMEQMF
jgi:exonuclease III